MSLPLLEHVTYVEITEVFVVVECVAHNKVIRNFKSSN